jgi:integrase
MIPLKVQDYSRNVARVGFHSLRHAHITALLEGGIPMDVVRQQAGHASLEIDGPLLPRQQQSVAGRYGRTSRDRQEFSRPKARTQ